MRRFIVTAGAVVALAVFCGTVRAGDPYGDGWGYDQSPNYGYQVNNNYFGGGPYVPSYGYTQPYHRGFESFSEAAWRIRAEHSRYRYFTHPLSLQNGPPVPDNYYGWGY